MKVEQVRNTVADTMSISLMNMTALQWLRKTHHDLIEIVRTEYSVELRDNVQLAELVPRIALNIDSLFEKMQQRCHYQPKSQVIISRWWTMQQSTKSGDLVTGFLSKETEGQEDVDNPHMVVLLQA